MMSARSDSTNTTHATRIATHISPSPTYPLLVVLVQTEETETHEVQSVYDDVMEVLKQPPISAYNT